MLKDPLQGKKILLGVTGCIAAYKSALLIRELIKRGAKVKVVMTPAATEFISPLTLSTLSQNEVIVNIFPASQKDGTSLSTWHIDLALWADLMLIAPATVNTIAKIAHGFADNALTTLVSALRSPVIFAPAADVDMYMNKLTQENIAKLLSVGFQFVNPEKGELASGLIGEGRLASVDKIIDKTELILSGFSEDFRNKKLLITAGPTYEDIDPVRFIGNRSSGKMGYAIAKAAFLRGADVTLISGPSKEVIYPEIKILMVRSASEMEKTVKSFLPKNEILIMAAAVSDFKPVAAANKKIKKTQKFNSIEVTHTNDILATLKKDKQIIVGFALETENAISNARNKLLKKNLDMIVLNSANKKGSGFEFDTNQVVIIKQKGKPVSLPLMSKFQTANHIISEINKLS